MKRWWYGLTPWPNPEVDYAPLLSEKSLRLVSHDAWITEPEIVKEKRKVLAVEAFPGVFKDSQGQIIDLRDPKSKPSYANLKAKSVPQLAILLKKCLKNQIKQLRASSYYEQNLDYALTKFLAKFLQVYENFLKDNN